MYHKKHMIRVLATGGILTPSYLLNILNIAKICDQKHVHFGSRQDLLFQVSQKQMAAVRKAFDELQIRYIIHGRSEPRAQNIVSSYVSSDMIAATPWLTSGHYLFILEHFKHQPTLRINITDPKQSLVPLFYGNLNFVASQVKDYWYLYLRSNENTPPERWPVLVLSDDIASLSEKLDEHWEVLRKTNLVDFYDFIQAQVQYNSRKIEIQYPFNAMPPHDYEGFGKMYSSQNYWAGFYWRNNCYDISFLEAVCSLCLNISISKICLTPWKSFLIKEIQEKDLLQWHRLLGRFGINMRHASPELNWHLPLRENQSLCLKRFIAKKFDALDICLHGLTFGIKTKAELSFTSIVIQKVNFIKLLGKFDPFITYRILHARDFNVNTCEYEEFMPQVPKHRLPEVLQSLTLRYYAQLLKTNEKTVYSAPQEKKDEQIVFQCPHCLSIYNEKIGAMSKGIPANTAFTDLPHSFNCPLCEAPKSDFKALNISYLLKYSNA